MPDASHPPSGPSARLERLDRLWRRHGRTFWILHSIWALATGCVVLWLAHERYGFVPWVVAFLGLTWASTLFFSRPPASAGDGFRARFGRGLASYLMRVMYQETLFFLLPFYFYSTVFASWNVTFVAVLALLATLSCLDMLFDRWLRESPVFGLLFFASVSFAALNLLLPLLLGVRPSTAMPLAALGALASAAPLAARGTARGVGAWLRLSAAGSIILVVAIGLPFLVPPVPLRMERITFAADVDRATLEPAGTLGSEANIGPLGGQLAVIARVFAPSNLPARVALDWYHEGRVVRSSREVEIIAHAGGFRMWDILRPESGALAPGRYRLVLRTADGRVFGTATVRLR